MILVITMVAGLGVMEVKADDAVESYNLWVGETEVTSANSSGSGWSYDDETTTLTLNGFQYCGNGHTGSDDCFVGGIYYFSYGRPENKKTLTIKLEGNNRIECTNGHEWWNGQCNSKDNIRNKRSFSFYRIRSKWRQFDSSCRKCEL